MKLKDSKLKAMKARRVIAYFLDSIIVWILFQAIVLPVLLSITGFTVKNGNMASYSILYLLGILFNFGYYTLFWTKSLKRTLGQIICKLQLKRSATVKECIVRLAYLHLSSIFYWVGINYMSLRGLTGDTLNDYIHLLMIICITIQFIYAYNIKRFDKITGIEVVGRNGIN